MHLSQVMFIALDRCNHRHYLDLHAIESDRNDKDGEFIGG
jgi:hypothetical protein